MWPLPGCCPMIAGLLKDRNDYCHRLSMLERLSASCVCTKPAHVQAEGGGRGGGARGTIPAGSGAVAGQTSPSKVTVAVAQAKVFASFPAPNSNWLLLLAHVGMSIFGYSSFRAAPPF